MIEPITRVCAVCERRYIPTLAEAVTLTHGQPSVCNAESCQIHGRVDIVVPHGLFPSLEDWKIFLHTSNQKHPYRELQLHRTQIRFIEKTWIVIITEQYDQNSGFFSEPTYLTQEHAYAVAQFRMDIPDDTQTEDL